MFADLPPSSSVTFFTVPLASCMMRRPTSVEPVNATLSTSGCCASSSPALPPGPVMRLTTPAGMPASSTAFTISIALSDVKLAGFNVTQLPAAIAGAIFQLAMMKREVPRHDAAAHAERLAPNRALGGRERRGAAVDDVGLVLGAVGEERERTGAARHVGEHRLLDRAAAVARLDLGDPGVRADQLRDLAQLLRALLARHLRPGPVVEGVARGLHGALRVLATGLGDVGDLLARRRGEGLERLTGLGVDPFAVDEELGVGHCGLPLVVRNARGRLVAMPLAIFQVALAPEPCDLALGLELQQVGVHLMLRHLDQTRRACRCTASRRCA